MIDTLQQRVTVEPEVWTLLPFPPSSVLSFSVISCPSLSCPVSYISVSISPPLLSLLLTSPLPSPSPSPPHEMRKTSLYNILRINVSEELGCLLKGSRCLDRGPWIPSFRSLLRLRIQHLSKYVSIIHINYTDRLCVNITRLKGKYLSGNSNNFILVSG